MRASHVSLMAAIAMATLLVVAQRLAYAHASPASEQPMAGSTVKASPAEVEIRFDNPVEAMFCHLQVRDRNGVDVTASAPAVTKDGIALSVKLKPLAAGDYTVKWTVVADDGHRSQGSYTFNVARGSD